MIFTVNYGLGDSNVLVSVIFWLGMLV
jgi:hypothetical protein